MRLLRLLKTAKMRAAEILSFPFRGSTQGKLQKNEKDAIKVSMRGTGLALLGAGASSISGFSILSFAPMPLFATYGILSAFMITFAMLASVLIVPSLLLIVRKLEKGKL